VNVDRLIRRPTVAMHTYLYRVNALFTVASTALAIMCAATALTDWTFPTNPAVNLKVKSYDGLLVRLLCSTFCQGQHTCDLLGLA
jgi:hypothetical protein